ACQLVGVYANGKLSPTAKELDSKSKGFISKAIKQSAFEGKPGHILPIFDLPVAKINHIILVGCGSEEKLGPAVFNKIVHAATSALAFSDASVAISYLAEINVTGKSLAWKIKYHTEVYAE